MGQKQFGGTTCRQCKKGKYHFIGLTRERKNGLSMMYLRYECNKCNAHCRIPYRVITKNEQVKMEEKND